METQKSLQEVTITFFPENNFIFTFYPGTNAFQLSTGALYAERECGRQGRPTNGISTSNQFDQISFDRDRESGGRPIFDNVLGQQQLPDDEEEPLPGYTPTSNFGNCASEGKTTAYEKVVDYLCTSELCYEFLYFLSLRNKSHYYYHYITIRWWT